MCTHRISNRTLRGANRKPVLISQVHGRQTLSSFDFFAGLSASSSAARQGGKTGPLRDPEGKRHSWSCESPSEEFSGPPSEVRKTPTRIARARLGAAGGETACGHMVTSQRIGMSKSCRGSRAGAAVGRRRRTLLVDDARHEEVRVGRGLRRRVTLEGELGLYPIVALEKQVLNMIGNLV